MGELGLREQFKERALSGPKYEEVCVPEIGTVFVKKLTAGEKDAFEAASPSNKIERVPALIHGCYDERGARIFADGDKDFVAQLDAELTDPIVIAFMKLNRYTKEGAEDLAKNSNGQAVNS
jgi:hypothetical protein